LQTIADIILDGDFEKDALAEATAEYDEYLSKEAARKGKSLEELRAQDVVLWEKWKANGEKPEDLRPLLKNARGLIRSKSNFWASRADLPPAAVHAEFTNQYVNAIKSYDPNKGTALGSWATTNLKKAYRWVMQHQDPMRTQENRYYQMGKWDNAHANLSEQLNRDPTTREMSEAMGMSESEAGRMESEKRGTLYSSGFEGGYDPTQIMPSEEGERLKLVRYELNDPRELAVFDYTVGMYGKPQLRPSEIAKKLKTSPSTITRIRQKIAKKLGEY
jgi:hypothetical protein